MIGGSAQLSIRLSRDLRHCRTEPRTTLAIVRAVARAVPLRTVNGRLRDGSAPRF